MRNAFLVAWRDFAESAKTKGYWIGLLLFPVMILAFIWVPQFLEKKGTPQRYFVLLDQAGQFDEVVSEGLERAHQRRVLRSLLEYARKNTARDKGKEGARKKIDLESIPGPEIFRSSGFCRRMK